MRTLKGTAAHIRFLENLCVGRLERSWTYDRQAAAIALTMLEAVGLEDKTKMTISQHFKVVKSRGLQALQVIARLKAQQEHKRAERGDEFAPEPAATLHVLWVAVCNAWFELPPGVVEFSAALGESDIDRDTELGKLLKGSLHEMLHQRCPSAESYHAVFRASVNDRGGMVQNVLKHDYASKHGSVMFERVSFVGPTV